MKQTHLDENQDYFLQNIAQLIATLNASISKMMVMIDETKDLNATLSRIEDKIDLIFSHTVNEIYIKPENKPKEE